MNRVISQLVVLVLLSLCGLTFLGLPVIWQSKRESSLVDEKLSGAALQAALQALTPDQVNRFVSRELSVLALEPLETTALQNLAVLYGLRGEQERQLDIALLAPRFSKRNIGAQLIAATIKINRTQYADALEGLDELLRAHPAMGPSVFPTMAGLFQQKKGDVELIRVLKNDPAWRGAFVEYVLQNDRYKNSGYSLLTMLRKEKAEVRVGEVRSLVNSFVKAKEIDQAYFVWLDFLPTEDLHLVQSVFDGNFDRDPKNLIFDWTIVFRPNARISVVDRPGSATNQSLLLEFVGDKGQFSNVFQYLMLSPGRYDVTYEFMAQNLKTASGLVWRVRCLSGAELGQGPKSTLSGPWADYKFEIQVPESGCTSQVLGLESSSTAALDTLISGQMYFDTFRIQSKDKPPSTTAN
jgi:hypothetical protein